MRSRDASDPKWWKLAHFAPEPEHLFLLLCLGVIISFTGYIAAAGIPAIKQVCGNPKDALFWGWRCPSQLENRTKRLKEYKCAIEKSRVRRDAFDTAQHDRNSRFYVIAPNKLEEENRRIKELEGERERLQVRCVAQSWPWPLYLALASILAFVTGRLMLLHAKSAVPLWKGESELRDWFWPYLAWVLIPFGITAARELATSVFEVNKQSFGWASFCVCSTAWWFILVLHFGVHMVIAYPAAIAWCASRTKYRPPTLKRDATDGAWGVRDYLLSLQTWSISVILVLFPSTVLWAQFAAEAHSWKYLIEPGALFLGSLLVAGRLVYQAAHIRITYFKEHDSLGSRSKTESLNLPGDPTVGFLGERWWSLPAGISGALATMWAIAKWFIGPLIERLLAGGPH